MENIYYVYVYLRKSNGTPYYVGKGKNNRAFEKHGRIEVPNDVTKIQMLKENLTNDEAIALEIELISQFGRRDINTGILLNLTNGGDGLVNPGPETREKMSYNTRNGITGMLGKKHSDDTIKKMSEAAKKRGFTDNHRAKITAALTGKQKGPMSESQRNAISVAKKGKSNGRLGMKHSAETKQNIQLGIVAAGYTHSKETREKMSRIKKDKATMMTIEEREIRYGNCKGKPWSEARRASQMKKKGDK